MSYGAMKPAKFTSTFNERKHRDCENKLRYFFCERVSFVYGNQVELMEYVCSNNESLLTASFNISLKVAGAKRPFYVGEDLMLPRWRWCS
jgi:hypothetical protein